MTSPLLSSVRVKSLEIHFCLLLYYIDLAIANFGLIAMVVEK